MASRSALRRSNWIQEWLDSHPTVPSSFCDQPSDSINGEERFGSRIYSLCLQLLKFLSRQKPCKPQGEALTLDLKEEIGRFYLWGEAFGNGELDRALDYSDDVRKSVLRSLGDIVTHPFLETKPCLQKEAEELRHLVDQNKIVAALSKDKLFQRDESDTGETDESDIEDSSNLVEELRLQTQFLKQLSPILERNLVKASRMRPDATDPSEILRFSVSGPAQSYVSSIWEKFKEAEDQLLKRLGEANWQRHVTVRELMARHPNDSVAPPSSDWPLSIAQTKFRPYSAFHDSGIGSSMPTQTSYAPSHSSFRSSNAEGGQEALRVPPTPIEVSEGKPFQCFICKRSLSNIKNRVDWKDTLTRHTEHGCPKSFEITHLAAKNENFTTEETAADMGGIGNWENSGNLPDWASKSLRDLRLRYPEDYFDIAMTWLESYRGPVLYCLDCPATVEPGPGTSAVYFERHLQGKPHRERVKKRTSLQDGNHSQKTEGHMEPDQSVELISKGTSIFVKSTGAETAESLMLLPPHPPKPHMAERGKAKSSYWSELEKGQFLNLIQGYGTNWQAIAQQMKTKTARM
ncbi:MAG: hypothetical protein Q9225_006934, partial [Loekoesia sp. 1 TL-2023]